MRVSMSPRGKLLLFLPLAPDVVPNRANGLQDPCRADRNRRWFVNPERKFANASPSLWTGSLRKVRAGRIDPINIRSRRSTRSAPARVEADYFGTHFCEEQRLSLCTRGHSFRRDDVDMIVFCFAERPHAEQFQARFRGEFRWLAAALA